MSSSSIQESAIQWALEVIQPILAFLYLPHEFVHYLAIYPWCPDPSLHFSIPREDWSHPYIPAMAQVTGTIPEGTNPGLVRFAAFAPTITFPILVILLSQSPFLNVLSESYYAVLLYGVFSSLPSGVDFHSFIHPEGLIQAGYFGAEVSEASWVWDLYAVLIGICIGTLILVYPIVI